ncbi:MAG TPA: arginase family protein [Chitinophagaceae bacterium]|nr:arginase family protein [Chitinophagaceae bacterium]
MAFNAIDTIISFLDPIDVFTLSGDEGYKDYQLGKHIAIYEESFPDLENADMVLVGCGETRGAGRQYTNTEAPDVIRAAFYALHYWHTDVLIADVGNVKTGETLQDTYAALRAVISELLQHKKKVVILGGSHDIMLAQYSAYAELKEIIEVANVDATIDITLEPVTPAEGFLLPMLTGEPNYVRHYNHVGFQSYFVHPAMLETIDKLGFDCYRVGKIKEEMEEIEPVIRNAQLFAFDIAAIQNCHAPANRLTPNGFSGEEACLVMRYAGMGQASTVGIYGYLPQQDVHELTAKQISHMLWYLIDGMQRSKNEEEPVSDNENFVHFRMAFGDFDTEFLRSKITGRWWMQLPGGKFMPCSYKDYLTASQNEMPERWLRAIERS